VLLLLGIFDLGRVVWANDTITNAAREAARWAIVHGGSVANITPCPVGPPSPLIAGRLPIAPGVCPHPTSPSKEGVAEVARKYLAAAGDVDVQVCYGEGCTGNTDIGTSHNGRGEPVTVTVLSTIELVGGGMIGIGSLDISAEVTMTVSH
jgi:hypothetical protein